MKLDIAQALAATFAFLFRNIGDVLRTVWLLTAVQLAAFFLLMPGYVQATAGLATADDQEEATSAMSQAIPGFGMFGCSC